MAAVSGRVGALAAWQHRRPQQLLVALNVSLIAVAAEVGCIVSMND